MGFKKVEIWIADKTIETNLRKEGLSYLSSIYYTNNQDLEIFTKLSESGKLRPVGEALKIITLDTHKSKLFRGINTKNLKLFLKYGTDKIEDNISWKEKGILKELGLSAQEVTYCGPLWQAWEAVQKNNPIIIIAYNENMLEKIVGGEYGWYYYKLKKGYTFRNAVEYYLMINFR